LDVSYGAFEKTFEHTGEEGNDTSVEKDEEDDGGGLLRFLFSFLRF
jgi:hypothetical protein